MLGSAVQLAKTIPGIALIIILIGCSSIAAHQLNREYGKPHVQERLVTHDSSQGQFYLEKVEPILEKRCIVCHGCYDAPCQLKLTSPAGIDRGATKELVYGEYRILASEPTRLGIDANITAEWRKREFFPVLNERQQSPEANREASLLYQLLEQKKKHPLPNTKLLPDSFDISLKRDQVCTRIENHDEYLEEKPLWGMPYALPQLEPEEVSVIQQWVEQGAIMAYPPGIGPGLQEQVNKWEAFLNKNDLEHQLVARYIYEHWFLASLYFKEHQQRTFFKLVRSRTPPGQPIDIIATRRPFEDPGVYRVFYRFQREEETILSKTHMPYALNDERLDWIRDLFFTDSFKVEKLPSYHLKVSSNPFWAFRDIPAKARYEFMLEEAQFTIMGFIKGPVCRGKIALNVINDHFWVFFTDPDKDLASLTNNFINDQIENLRLPAEYSSTAGLVTPWIKFSSGQTDYLKAKSEALQEMFPGGSRLNMSMVWDGDGHNDNAALTIFRHIDSATVVKGLVGQTPKTAWVIDYPMLERIHYLLVAGFDVYGNIGHHTITRLYMDFLRLEGEFNFLTLLPEAERMRLRDFWYRDAGDRVKSFLHGHRAYLNAEPDINYKTDEPLQELYGMLQKHLQPVLNNEHSLAHPDVPEKHRLALAELMQGQGKHYDYLPQIILLTVVDGSDREYLYTLLMNTAHKNITSLLWEDKNLVPEENTLTVVRGVGAAYPGVFLKLHESELGQLVGRIETLSSPEDYAGLVDDYGIRRTHPLFWQHSDTVHELYQQLEPISYGYLDFNRLENR